MASRDPLVNFVARIKGGKRAVFALLERSTHDDDAVKLTEAWRKVKRMSGTSETGVHLDAVLDLSGFHARDFVSIVTRCAYDFNIEAAKGIFAMHYPALMAASMRRAVQPDATREREIHFASTGHLPTAKAIQIVQQNISTREPGEAPSVASTARRIVRDLPPAS